MTGGPDAAEVYQRNLAGDDEVKEKTIDSGSGNSRVETLGANSVLRAVSA